MNNTKKNSSNNNLKYHKKSYRYRKRAYKPQFIQNKEIHSIDQIIKQLDKLYTLFLSDSEIDNKLLESLKQLCEEINLIEDENISLISIKYCEIIEFITKSKQQLYNNVLFNLIVNNLKKLFLSSKELKWYCNRVKLLRTMSIVLFENSPFCDKELFNELVHILIPFCDPTVLDKDIVRLSTTCLGNLCTKRGPSGKSHYNTIFDVLYRNYLVLIEDIKVSGNSKLLASTIRSIQLILLESSTFYETHISSLVNSLSKLIYFGTTIFPIQIDFQDIDESSGSEYSGSDIYIDKFQTWKVRYHSIGCVQALVKCSGPSKFVRYWSSFLPQSPHQPSLISIIMTDPVHQVRSAAAKLLSIMFEGQKNLLKTSTLSTSKLNTPSLPYTPLSLKLRYITKEIENNLLKVLENETVLSTKVQILKTLCVFVQQIPYNESNFELRKNLISLLINLSYNSTYKDNSLIKTAYRCLYLLLSNALEQENLQKQEKGNIIELSFIKMLLNVLDDTTSPFLAEIYKIISSIALNYPELIEETFDKIFLYISRDTNTNCSDDIDPMVRLSAIKVIDELTKVILEDPSKVSQDFPTKLWKVILESHITTLGNDRFSQIRAVFCNIFSRIHSNMFDMLHTKQQIMMITLILGLTYDENSLVKSQACRTIGVFILNNSLKVNPLFVSDSGVALVKAMKDRNLNVRIRAAWALANLCDSLVLVKESEVENSMTDDIPIDILISIAKCAIHATRDNEKVKPNAVRALGNFVRFSSKFLFTEQEGSSSLFSNIVSSLIQCTKEGSAKTRWNSCYALGNIFRNKAIIKLDMNSILSAIKVLIFQIRSSKNYKVMINALMALSIPSREFFSSKFIDCFIEISDLLMCFDVKSEFDDCTSHNYKDSFLTQSINTYLHLNNIMTNEDMKDNTLRCYMIENKEKLMNSLSKICDESCTTCNSNIEKILQNLENIYCIYK